MSKQSLEERIRIIAEPIAAEIDLEIVHVEISGPAKNQIVRIFIDKSTGVTHEDCAQVSSRVGEVIESEDFIPNAYVLEVSSPGLERGLYNLADFERFVGKLARIKTYSAVRAQKNFAGRIIEIKGDEIVFEDQTSGEFVFPFSSVAKANLLIDIEEELKRAKDERR